MAREPKQVRYVVYGHGPFPMDMLRYDEVHPATEDDAAKIGMALTVAADREAYFATREVTVVGRDCTAARWCSFGWQVRVPGPNR